MCTRTESNSWKSACFRYRGQSFLVAFYDISFIAAETLATGGRIYLYGWLTHAEGSEKFCSPARFIVRQADDPMIAGYDVETAGRK